MDKMRVFKVYQWSAHDPIFYGAEEVDDCIAELEAELKQALNGHGHELLIEAGTIQQHRAEQAEAERDAAWRSQSRTETRFREAEAELAKYKWMLNDLCVEFWGEGWEESARQELEAVERRWAERDTD